MVHVDLARRISPALLLAGVTCCAGTCSGETQTPSSSDGATTTSTSSPATNTNSAASSTTTDDTSTGTTGVGPTNVLFVGNSHTFVNDLPSVFASLAPETFTVQSLTAGGVTLSNHWRDDAITRIFDTRPDIVILQEQSGLGGGKDEFLDAVGGLSAVTKSTGGRAVMYMLWHYPDLVPAANDEAGELFDVAVSPVGPVFHRLAETHPELQLISNDGSHPAVLGTYAAAVTLYATVTASSPVGRGPGGLAIEDGVAAAIQSAAWDVYQAAPHKLADQTPAPDDVGDTVATATPVAVGDSVSRVLGNGDLDVFTTELSETTAIAVRTDPWHSILLTDAAGSLLGNTDDPDSGLREYVDNRAVAYRVLDPGAYAWWIARAYPSAGPYTAEFLAVAQAGESCSQQLCAPGAYCRPQDKVCTPPGSAGDPCSDYSHCVTELCEAGTCQPLPPP